MELRRTVTYYKMDLNKSKTKLRLEIVKNYNQQIFNLIKLIKLNRFKKINLRIIKHKDFKTWKATLIHN